MKPWRKLFNLILPSFFGVTQGRKFVQRQSLTKKVFRLRCSGYFYHISDTNFFFKITSFFCFFVGGGDVCPLMSKRSRHRLCLNWFIWQILDFLPIPQNFLFLKFRRGICMNRNLVKTDTGTVSLPKKNFLIGTCYPILFGNRYQKFRKFRSSGNPVSILVNRGTRIKTTTTKLVVDMSLPGN